MNYKPRNLSTNPVSIDELLAFGIDGESAQELSIAIARCLAESTPQARWLRLTQEVLSPTLPFDLHHWLFHSVYIDHDDDASGTPTVWTPTPQEVTRANVTHLAQSLGLENVRELHRWSVDNQAKFWQTIVESIGIQFSNEACVETCPTKPNAWLPQKRFNIAQSCFLARPDKTAIIQGNENGEIRTTTYQELQVLVNRVANGLVESGFVAGDRVGIMMPMTIESVAAYLGCIQAGCVPVSIAESFATREISMRMQLSSAKGIFLTDYIHRAGKQLACYEKFRKAESNAKVILIATRQDHAFVAEPNVFLWNEFLSDNECFDAIAAEHTAETNILFSSGTTGQPKAIPWTQTTPIKCATDARLHQNVHTESVVAWPTSLGWMMGPWLIYASLLNRGTMALFDGAPNTRSFCQFVQDAKITMLGVIPSLIRAWRSGNMTQGVDWSSIESFSSTGECSNADDMLFLMSQAGYRPVIEYCGGTELGGGYISSTVVQPNRPACFSIPAFGVDLVLVDDDQVADKGEVFLVGPSIGFSQTLLNADHQSIYFANTPTIDSYPELRRHGDELIRLKNDYYRACGRIDDAMNLGGIKVSAIELERCLNGLAEIKESACVAINDSAGGPARLVVFVVIEDQVDVEALTTLMQKTVSSEVNPLFRIARVVPIDALPRTASNKVMRRKLREMAD